MSRVLRNKRTGQVVTNCPTVIADLRIARYPSIWEELIEIKDETPENIGQLETPKPKPKTTRKRKPKAE